MKVVIQRVKKAKVKVDSEIVASINSGYLLLVGFNNQDYEEVVRKTAEKIKNLRIFSDQEGKMNLAIEAIKGEILSVSQFTLYADISGGRRPSFVKAAPAETAERLYNYFNQYLKDLGLVVKTGVFQKEMSVSLENDGPVTIIVDSEELQ